MAPLCYRRHRFPPEIIQHAIWLYLRFTLSYRDVEELLAERRLDISYETVRRWVLKFGPAIARRLRRRRPRPSDRWHLDEMVVRIAGERMYLWRAVDDEGEVLDMLVQRRRDSRSALRLMRKLLKKQGFVPKLLVTDKLRSYASAFRLTCRHEQGLRRRETIGRRIRTRQSDDASASCSDSSQLDPPIVSSASTARSTTPSIFNATSSPDPHCGSSAPKLLQSGKTPSQRHDAWPDLVSMRAPQSCRDKAGNSPQANLLGPSQPSLSSCLYRVHYTRNFIHISASFAVKRPSTWKRCGLD
jgi:putative transposase